MTEIGMPAIVHETAASAAGDGASRTSPNAVLPPAPVASIAAQLVELGALRRHHIGVQRKVSNANGAIVRRLLGWRADLEASERERIRRRAAKLIAAIEAGKPTADEIESYARPLVLAAAASREPFDALRRKTEAEMRRLARRLPGFAFVDGVAGFGELGFAVMQAEAGDPIGDYRSTRGLWKRLGLALVDGERQRRFTDPEKAAAHGYSPRRRAEVHACIGEPLLRAQWRGEREGVPAHPIGPYGEAYGTKRAEYVDRGWGPGHAHMAALRYMTKLLIRDLRAAWRREAAHGEK